MNESRKLKKEELLMKRRGLNFITDSVVETMDEESIINLENEVDNVAPKIVGILALNSSCDINQLRTEMVNHCIEYQRTLHKAKNQEDVNGLEVDTELKAYVCPNPGSSTNLGSKKQRLIFTTINRDDPHAVLEAGKIADIILVVMSASDVETTGLKIDPDRYSHAIDEIGYRSLGLLRS
jgi:hypothetical protein